MTAAKSEQAISESHTARQIAAEYFASWAAHDAQGFRALLTDDVTWSGPTWTAANAEECMTAFRAAAGHLTRIEVKHVWVDGDAVLTWLDLYAGGNPPRPVANCMTVRNGKVVSVHSTADLVRIPPLVSDIVRMR